MTKTKKKTMRGRARLLFLAGALLSGPFARAQDPERLSLAACLRMAEDNYPVARQFALVEKTRELSLANASKGILPKISIGGQASYQSDVTKIPIALPNFAIPTPGKDQYRLYGEVSQPITGLFTLKHQKDLVKASAEADRHAATAELHKARERVNRLYFGILLIDAQMAQTDILKKDIRAGMASATVAIANGIALKSSADLLQAELIRAEQRTIELKHTRRGYAEMLSLFIGRTVDAGTVLEKPDRIVPGMEIRRTELKLFEAQKKTIEVRKKLIDDRTLPRLSVFLQGGYGRPGLNMLERGFSPYYIGGLRLVWDIAPFYTRKQDRQLLTVSQNAMDVQKETFLFNTNLTIRQQNSEAEKLEELMRTDQEIVRLRENVKRTAQHQLEHGTITANDYQTHLHAADRARQDMILHEIQLLMALYDGQLTVEN